MKRIAVTFVALALGVSVLGLAGCKARKTYPEPDLGWHSSNYGVIYGRLQRIPAKNPDDPPIWVIRYALSKDAYRGELALSPLGKLDPYSGGEMVEIRGAVRNDKPRNDYPGTWYEVQSVRLWVPYKGK